MISIETDFTLVGETTLVWSLVQNTYSTPQEVSVSAALDDEVWSSRKGDGDRSMWDGKQWCGVVGADRVRGIGFSTPRALTSSDEPLVRIESTEAATQHDSDGPDDSLTALADRSPTSAVGSPDR